MRRNPAEVIVLGTPDGRRVRATVKALADVGVRTTVINWRSVLEGTARFGARAVVKIEPPEAPDDEPILRHLVQRGRATLREEPPIAPGELREPGALARGWSLLWTDLAHSLAGHDTIVPPTAIRTMFDKHDTATRVRDAGVPVVPTHVVHESDLSRLLHGRAFVKLRFGSGGHGIGITAFGQLRASFDWRPLANGRFGWGHVRGLPTVADPVAALAFLAAQGAVAQPVVRPLVIDGWVTDLRIVVLQGEVAGAIWRQSRHPVTNLEQGGRRGDPARCTVALPPRALADARVHAQQAVAAVGSSSGGVDLVFDRFIGQFFVLEVNPFGDFFPGWINEAGRTLPQVFAARVATQMRNGSVSPSAPKQ